MLAILPIYLRPSAPTAADALICGDPARALTIAQHVMVQPRMSNHHRGLWGYFGETPAGKPLTVQATGIGGPSAVAVLTEAIDLGVRRVIRIGTCAATGERWRLGTAAVIDAAIAGDGTSVALGAVAGETIEPDRALTAALAGSLSAEGPLGADRAATIMCADLMVDAAGHPGPALRDLQTAAVLSLCSRRSVGAAVAVVVRSLNGRRLDDEPLDAALLKLAAAAATALDQAQP